MLLQALSVRVLDVLLSTNDEHARRRIHKVSPRTPQPVARGDRRPLSLGHTQDLFLKLLFRHDVEMIVISDQPRCQARSVRVDLPPVDAMLGCSKPT